MPENMRQKPIKQGSGYLRIVREWKLGAAILRRGTTLRGTAMPAQNKQETLMRNVELLRAVPHQSWVKTSELTKRLSDRGYKVNKRTVERDLKALESEFGLQCTTEGRTNLWKWREPPREGIGATSASEALVMVMVEQYMTAALPPMMLESFRELFAKSHAKLNSLAADSKASNWLKKVRAVSPVMPVIAPTIDRKVHEAISEALLADRQVRTTYVGGGTRKEKTYVMNPLALLLRGSTTYLMATVDGYEDVRLYALQRFRSAEPLLQPVAKPKNFNIDREIDSGTGQFKQSHAKISLEFTCAAWLAAHLAEAPLAEGQTISALGPDRHRVQVTVPNTWQLHWWVLARGADVEIIKPASLRKEIADIHRAAFAQYTASPSR